MGKIRRQADEAALRASQELTEEEERERAGAAHFREQGLSTPWHGAAGVAHVADAASTIAALNADPRAREANPLLRPAYGKGKVLGTAAKLAVGAAGQYAADKVARSGHKKLAKVMSAVNTAVPAAAAVSNTLAVRRLKRRK